LILQIVDPQSATMPGGYQFYTIPEDHEKMTKFLNRSSSGYKDVLVTLLSMGKSDPKPAADAVRERYGQEPTRGPVNSNNVVMTSSSVSSGRDTNIGSRIGTGR
jgi:hypothetical protein